MREALLKAMQLRQALADSERQAAEKDQQIQQITQEQNRIRENMKTVAQNTPLYTRLIKKLDDQESTIEKLQSEKEDLKKKADAQRNELADYLNNLNVG